VNVSKSKMEAVCVCERRNQVKAMEHSLTFGFLWVEVVEQKGLVDVRYYIIH